MEILDISADEYERIVGNDVYVYCGKAFLELNKEKVDKVHYLVGKDSKYRIALAIGEKGNEWCAPYSAPFADIVLLKDDVTVENIWDFIKFYDKNGYARAEHRFFAGGGTLQSRFRSIFGIKYQNQGEGLPTSKYLKQCLPVFS